MDDGITVSSGTASSANIIIGTKAYVTIGTATIPYGYFCKQPRLFYCEYCGTYSEKPGTCKHCGAPLTKEE